jgi:hypothetical protein
MLAPQLCTKHTALQDSESRQIQNLALRIYLVQHDCISTDLSLDEEVLRRLPSVRRSIERLR